MGFLERAIRRGVSDAVSKAIGKAIEPTVTEEFVDFDEVTSSLVNFASGEETDIMKDNQVMKALEMLEE